MPKSDPPASQVEAENTDAVMTEANVEPTPTKAPEVSEANDATTSVPAPAAGP